MLWWPAHANNGHGIFECLHMFQRATADSGFFWWLLLVSDIKDSLKWIWHPSFVRSCQYSLGNKATGDTWRYTRASDYRSLFAGCPVRCKTVITHFDILVTERAEIDPNQTSKNLETINEITWLTSAVRTSSWAAHCSSRVHPLEPCLSIINT